MGMSLRQLADPHLATLRTAGRALSEQDADTWEQARFNLFRALDRNDDVAARDWLNALEAHLIVFADKLAKVSKPINRAISEIDNLLD